MSCKMFLLIQGHWTQGQSSLFPNGYINCKKKKNLMMTLTVFPLLNEKHFVSSLFFACRLHERRAPQWSLHATGQSAARRGFSGQHARPLPWVLVRFMQEEPM